MKTRRQIILALSALAGGTLAYSLGNNYQATNRYKKAVADTWQHSQKDLESDSLELHRELIRYATLAASSHNTQCWKFQIEDDSISILPDWSDVVLL